MAQIIIKREDGCTQLDSILKEINAKKFLLVCHALSRYMHIKGCIDKFGIPYIKFNDFEPNPLYEDVCKGVKLFNDEKCDFIIAIGGGSAIDVAKCIKLFSRMNPDINYLKQEYKVTGIPLIVVPTTAGTGSESTRYAVIYYNGEKQSITHESIIPDYVILDHRVLKTLPLYQKKCTMLDALCQGIESWWSVNSTDESKEYSKIAVEMIIANMDAYLNENTDEAAANMMLAANYAGRAINITQTTAPHAMSYKLTSMYDLPHGHAVAICFPHVWRYMIDNIDKCIDNRGNDYLKVIFKEIASSLGVKSVDDAINKFDSILNELEINAPITDNEDDLIRLGKSVNQVRLKNNPVELSEKALLGIYQTIIRVKADAHLKTM